MERGGHGSTSRGEGKRLAAWVAANGWLGRNHWMQGEGLLSENIEQTLLLIYSRWVGGGGGWQWVGGWVLAG